MTRSLLSTIVTIKLDDGEDDEAIPHSFKRFLMHSAANGQFDLLLGNTHFSQHISFGEEVTGKERSIMRIPLVQALSHKKAPISRALVSALHQEHTIRCILETDDSCRLINKSHLNFPINLSKNKSVKDIRLEKRAEVAEATGKLIAKQYRQATLHLHPDRHGEAFRTEFDALQVAYEILKDEKTRGNYIDTMIKVIEKCKNAEGEILKATKEESSQRLGQESMDIVPYTEDSTLKSSTRSSSVQSDGILQMANTAFIVSFMKTKEKKDSKWKRYNEKTGRKSELFLEGSMFTQPPKALRVNFAGKTARKWRETTTRTVKLPPLSYSEGSTYQEICDSISIYAISPELDQPDKLLLNLTGNSLRDAFDSDGSGWITTSITLPTFDTWTVYWFASLKDFSNLKKAEDTPKSVKTEIICDTIQEFEARSRIPELVSEACRVVGLVRSSMNRWKAVTSNVVLRVSKEKELETHRLNLVRHVTSGRDTAESLWAVLEQVGYSRDAALSLQKHLNRLVTILDEADIVNQQASDLIQRLQNRQNIKEFKNLFVDLAVTGDLALWLRSVEESEISAVGSSCNRLYQLLMQGKWSCPTNTDYASVFFSASERYDLFSKKQLGALARRAKEYDGDVPARQPSEAKIDAESTEKEVRDFTPEHDDGPKISTEEDLMPMGTPVILQGLTKRPEMNGLPGKYVGAGALGRYNILVQGQCFALKLGTFVLSPSSDPALQHLYEEYDVATRSASTQKVSRSENRRFCTEDETAYATENNHQPRQISTWTTCSNRDTPRKTSNVACENKGRRATGKSQNSSSKEVFMWLPKKTVPRFIGRNAENIRATAVETKTRMFVDKNMQNQSGHVALRIEGTENAVQHAKTRVETLLRKWRSEQTQVTGSKEANSKAFSAVHTNRTGSSKNITQPWAESRSEEAATDDESVDMKLEDKEGSTPTFSSTSFCSDHPDHVSQSETDNTEGLHRRASTALVHTKKTTNVPNSIRFPTSGTGEEASAVTQHDITTGTESSSENPLCSSPELLEKINEPSQKKREDLLLFLKTEAGCLKNTPEKFYSFLLRMDVTSLVDLIDAIDDIHFRSEMNMKWVKGFKIETLRSTAVEELHQQSAETAFNIIPDGLGSLDVGPTKILSPTVQARSKNAPIGSKFHRQQGEGTKPIHNDFVSQDIAGESLFWGNWK